MGSSSIGAGRHRPGRRASRPHLRQELELREPADIRSPRFQRFVIRLSERMDFDIPREDYPQLATLRGCSEDLSRARC